MNRVFNFAVITMFAVIMTSSRVDAAVVNVTEGSTSCYTMTDGNTYVIQDSVSFSNSTAGGSGMEVEDGATVVIYVPAGITLTAIGANGSGQTGGGAGIRVPETATLVITGEGTVNVAGGNAGDGGNGVNGSEGSSISCAYGQYPTTVGGTRLTGGAAGKGSSGCGGSGGNGGGGAGVAIGGIGGCGGSGGSSGAPRTISSYVTLSGFCGNGNNGANGSAGMSGDSMGFCYLLGRTTVIAVAGQTGKSGVTGNKADWTYYL